MILSFSLFFVANKCLLCYTYFVKLCLGGVFMYIYKYKTPCGFSDMLMSSDGVYLTGLWFCGSRDASKHVFDYEEKRLPIFDDTIRWLDIYFSGKIPNFVPKYKVINSTSFRDDVISIMNGIPYGEVITYGDIAECIAKKRGLSRMSSQAVGGAVGWNPICIIIPCHRVVGSNGSLTGYGGGISNKIKLLELEGQDMNEFIIPTKGTAL